MDEICIDICKTLVIRGKYQKVYSNILYTVYKKGIRITPFSVSILKFWYCWFSTNNSMNYEKKK